ncbi:hypothetical protein KY290_007831 [Solanum tuberosum]|uniref:DUF1232 domain-containing protein n=1 Tax=Solanum tuberosum TaxID=4113 RepID=A0ABQ7W746_SOLTU|nr:hypothetical protein KY290_007831 [Solanum tuberosum]
MDHRRMMFVLSAMALSMSLVKLIVPIGFVLVVFYKFGIMDQPFKHVNVHYAVVRLPCWFLVSLHQGCIEILKFLRSYGELSNITAILVNMPMAFSSAQACSAICLKLCAYICGLVTQAGARMQDLPFLLRRLLRDMTDPQRSLPFVIRARVYLAVFLSGIYVLSPVDLIPEGFLGIIGLLDDLIIMFICFLHVAALYRSVLLFRHGGS